MFIIAIIINKAALAVLIICSYCNASPPIPNTCSQLFAIPFIYNLKPQTVLHKLNVLLGYYIIIVTWLDSLQAMNYE